MLGNILVFVPLHEEMQYIHAHMTERGGKCGSLFDRNTSVYVFDYKLRNRKPCRVTFYVIGDQGNVYTLSRIAPQLVSIKPNICFLIGLAGSLNPMTTKLGDVIVSSRAKAYYADKVKTLDDAKEVFTPRADIKMDAAGKIQIDDRKRLLDGSFLRFRRMFARAELSEVLVHDYAHFAGDSPPEDLERVDRAYIPGLPPAVENLSPSVKEGTVFGSEMVIDSEKFADFVLEKNDDDSVDYYRQKAGGRDFSRQKWFASPVDVVDMETFGFLMLGQMSFGVLGARHYFAVRGVSDLARSKEDLDSGTGSRIREIAVTNAIKTTLDMIEYLQDNKLGGL